MLESIIIAGIETPLDIASITLQDNRENSYKNLSRQEASTTLLFNKGKKL